MVVIDSQSCIGCGACVQDCPQANLSVEEGTAKVLGNCMQCGHCVAICPANAVRIPEYDMEDVTEYDPETFRLAPEQVLNAIKFRRSIRHFKNTAVPPETLRKIIEAGRYTETAVNRQDNRFIVVQEKLPEFRKLIWEGWRKTAEILREQSDPQAQWYRSVYEKYENHPERDPLFFGAPVLLTVASGRALNGGMASANMETMAVSLGLGVLVSGMIERAIKANPQAQEWLELGEKQLVSCMLVGYPQLQYRRTAPRLRADITWK